MAGVTKTSCTTHSWVLCLILWVPQRVHRRAVDAGLYEILANDIFDRLRPDAELELGEE